MNLLLTCWRTWMLKRYMRMLLMKLLLLRTLIKSWMGSSLTMMTWRTGMLILKRCLNEREEAFDASYLDLKMDLGWLSRWGWWMASQSLDQSICLNFSEIAGDVKFIINIHFALSDLGFTIELIKWRWATAVAGHERISSTQIIEDDISIHCQEGAGNWRALTIFWIKSLRNCICLFATSISQSLMVAKVCEHFS